MLNGHWKSMKAVIVTGASGLPSVGESPRVDIVDSGVGRARLGAGSIRRFWALLSAIFHATLEFFAGWLQGLHLAFFIESNGI
ncbi:MAG: hypothetical protein ACOYLD_14255, partial [Anaerohalosphaeraceae bacterium]